MGGLGEDGEGGMAGFVAVWVEVVAEEGGVHGKEEGRDIIEDEKLYALHNLKTRKIFVVEICGRVYRSR